jgi:hypothetical protein
MTIIYRFMTGKVLLTIHSLAPSNRRSLQYSLVILKPTSQSGFRSQIALISTPEKFTLC